MAVRTHKDWQRLLQAAQNGDADAQLDIAFHYESGLKIDGFELVRPDSKLAYEWTKRAYENGNLKARELFAYYLSNGLHCTKNTELAMKLYEEAIRAGSSDAAHNLGIEFRNQHNFEKAFSFYKRSPGDFSVGMCYYYGVGVPQNKLKAFRFFKRFLKSDIPVSGVDANEANYMVGKMYLEGEVVKKSLTKARHYLSLANEDGDHPSAQQILWVIGLE